MIFYKGKWNFHYSYLWITLLLIFIRFGCLFIFIASFKLIILIQFIFRIHIRYIVLHINFQYIDILNSHKFHVSPRIFNRANFKFRTYSRLNFPKFKFAFWKRCILHRTHTHNTSYTRSNTAIGHNATSGHRARAFPSNVHTRNITGVRSNFAA